MPRRWKRLRAQYDRLRVETNHILRGLEIPRPLRGWFTRDLHPELTEHHERLRQEIAQVLEEPSTRPNLEPLDARPTSEQAFIDTVGRMIRVDRPQAYATIAAVFEVLRDRLPYQECEHIARWLPGKLRRLIQKPRRQGVLRLSPEELVDRVARHLGVDVPEAIRRIRAVYAVLQRVIVEVAPDEPSHWLARLPRNLQRLLTLPDRSLPAST